MKLLITKQLTEDQLAKMRAWGWKYDVIPALQIEQRIVSAIPMADTWVVSSRNSLSAVEKFKMQVPPVIYVVGEWLRHRLNELTQAEVKAFSEMRFLAKEVAASSASEVLYFCADNHRDELTKALSGAGKKLTEVITHESKLTYPKLDRRSSYEAVIVFSPRSVESILHHNDIAKNTLFVSIGRTTDIFLRASGFTNTLYASAPDSDVMLDELHNYFKVNNVPNGL